jgi:hypothetical protein
MKLTATQQDGQTTINKPLKKQQKIHAQVAQAQ